MKVYMNPPAQLCAVMYSVPYQRRGRIRSWQATAPTLRCLPASYPSRPARSADLARSILNRMAGLIPDT